MGTNLVNVYRGGKVESSHSGHIAIVDAEGNLKAGIGNTNHLTYLRSTAKPFQAYPLVANGGIEKFDITQKELAATCSSHNAEEKHLVAVQSILSKIGLDRRFLQCGAHPPMLESEAEKQARASIRFEDMHNNCSGKHAGFLALARLANADLETYLSLDNPIQKEILKIISKFSEVPADEIATSIDGCSAPIFLMPIKNFSLLFAKLAKGIDEHLLRIRDAMIKHPFMVAGTGRFDTDLMIATNGRFVAKTGAEGVQCVGIVDGGPRPECSGWGVTVKIDDGNTRAKGPAIMEALNQIGVLTDDDSQKLENHYKTVQKNWAGKYVGEIIPEFTLEQ